MSTASIRAALKSQYQAALKTLEQTIADCPDQLWIAPEYANPYWQVAYHALYYTHLYLEQQEEAFTPWEKHREEYYHLGKQRREGEPELQPYSKEELLAYCHFCQKKAGQNTETLDLDHPESGFYWYQMPKLEHQIVNIRHLQHHAAQLADRLRNAAGRGTRWVQKGT